MATVYSETPFLFHFVARTPAGEFQHISGYGNRIALDPKFSEVFAGGLGAAPADFRLEGDTLTVHRIAPADTPADARPAKDQLAVELALAVLAGDMTAAAALADRLVETLTG